MDLNPYDNFYFHSFGAEGAKSPAKEPCKTDEEPVGDDQVALGGFTLLAVLLVFCLAVNWICGV